MRRKVFIAVGLILFGLTAVWQFGLVPRLTQRIPAGWSWQAEFIGFISYADPQTGKLPEKDETNIYQRGMHIVSETGRPRAVLMEDTLVILDPATGKKTWEYTSRSEVDPQTGAHLEKEYLGDVFVFPRFAEKKTYKFRNNYLKGVPLAFEREEEIEGVQTYLFAYRGRAEYTESYVGTPDFPGIKPEPGQEIRCGDDRFVFQVWVEPVTGEILKLDEGCLPGDQFYVKATNEKLGVIARWAGATAGDDDIQRAQLTSRDRSKLLWITRYIPLILLLAGGLCFGLAFVPGRVSKNEDADA
jgi:hypothetical protein